MEVELDNPFNFMENFPVLRDLVICRNISAHDKKGGNDNGFSNKAEWIRLETLRRAREIGIEAGLRFVYEGNVPGEGGEKIGRASCRERV